ncbi:LysE family translocator [Klebsiella sp. BIGb0407]|uniref:LysE family translocator n=1 Tax=Klebsiella sp. BIGb0407 TaxID=2940603 RepID=UPI002166C58D|nr:LysE family translocator [Klebsiella sp. BIGb0407]MCS3429986.1 threonine/homoserine/homoserine lactone efflux protein [Klebsiella sp. BIGb0407]
MDTFTTLLAIAATLAIGAISPGPSFVYVAQNAVARSRNHGLATAMGTGVGAAIFALLALLGLQAFLLAVPVAYTALKIVGGVYLLWLAYKIIRHSREPLSMGKVSIGEKSLLATFRDGLFTQLSNPKTAVVFASIFTALLPREIPAYYYIALPLISFIIDAGWYSLVTVALSTERSRNVYIRFKTVIDRVAGSVMGLLGLKLIFSSR